MGDKPIDEALREFQQLFRMPVRLDMFICNAHGTSLLHSHHISALSNSNPTIFIIKYMAEF